MCVSTIENLIKIHPFMNYELKSIGWLGKTKKKKKNTSCGCPAHNFISKCFVEHKWDVIVILIYH